MKKIFILFLLLVFPQYVSAKNDFSVELKSENSVTLIKELSEFSIDIIVNSSSDFYGFVGEFNFDKDKLEILETNEDNGFGCLVDKNIVIDKTKPKKGILNVCNIKFKAKEAFKNGESTEIKISNIEGAYDTFGNDVSIMFSIPKKYEAKLLSLTVDNYEVLDALEFTTREELITIDAITFEEAEVTGLGSKELKVGENIFKIIVTSKDNNVKEYILKVIRIEDIHVDDNENIENDKEEKPKDENNNEDNTKGENIKEEEKQEEKPKDESNKEEQKNENNNIDKNDVSNNTDINHLNILKTLIINNKIVQLRENVYEYYLNVNKHVKKIHVDYEKNNVNTSVILDGNLNLKNGNNVIKIILKLNNNADVIYTINVYKEYEDEEDNLNIDQDDKKENIVQNDITKKKEFLNTIFVIVIVLISIIFVILKKHKIKDR